MYGCVDNLAWVWVYENGLNGKIRRNSVGLRAKHKEVRSTLSVGFQDYLVKLDPWLDYIIEYRDALAHRIPLYVPPGGVPVRHVDAYNSLNKVYNRHCMFVATPTNTNDCWQSKTSWSCSSRSSQIP